MATHKPLDDGTLAAKFWIRMKDSVTELNQADFNMNDVTDFPCGYDIYNTHTWHSLGNKYKRAQKKGTETFGIKRINTPLPNGYQLIKLIPRKTRGSYAI